MAAIALSSLRVAMFGIERYKHNLEDRIGVLVGAPVRLEELGAKMRGISPELVLKEVDIAPTTGKPAIHLDEIRLGIDLGDLLVKRDMLASSWVTLVGAQLSVYRDHLGNFAIEGLDSGKGPPLWLLQGRQYKLLQSRIAFSDYFKDIKPFKLDEVNIAILNDGDRHRINVITQLPVQYGGIIKAALDLKGRADTLATFAGTMFIEGNRVKLPKLAAADLPIDSDLNFGLKLGSTDFKAWGTLHQGQLVGLKGDVQSNQSDFSQPNRTDFKVKNLDTQFHWKNKGQEWQLDVSRFVLSAFEDNKKSASSWPDLVFSLANGEGNGTTQQKYRLYAKQADLSEFTKLAIFFAPLPEGQKKRLGQSKLNGMLKDFSLYAEPDTNQFAVSGVFDSLSMEPFSLESGVPVPGLNNISGRLSGNDKSGKIQVDSLDVNLTADHVFPNTLVFSHLKGLVGWRQTDSDWSLSSQSIQLDCPAFNTESRVQIAIPKAQGKPFIDLQTSVKSDSLHEIANYLPTKIMKEHLKTWLEMAFIKGKVTNGGILFSGNLTDFPFNNGSGVLEAVFDLNDVELNFNPEWPHIMGINGQLIYGHSTIKGLFNHGTIGNVQITQAEALIPDLGSNQEQLAIKGEAQGNINEVLEVLQQSPIAHRVSSFAAGTTITGLTKGSMEMSVPLWPNQEMKLDGKTVFNNAELTVNKLAMKVKKVSGALKYNMKGIYSDDIKAFALGHPVAINVEQKDQDTLIKVDGRTRVSDIENLFNWPEVQFAEGEGAYQLQLQIPKMDVAEKKAVQVGINSTLEGFDLKLPGVLAKSGLQKKPSNLTVILDGDESSIPIQLNYNNELKAAVSFDAIAHKINSGHILVGSGGVTQRRVPGIKFEINKGQLPLQDWLTLAASQQHFDGAGFDLNEIKIQSDSAYWKKTRLGKFDLTLDRNPGSWSGEIDSSVAKGKFIVPQALQGSNPIVMDMDMLNLSALKQFKMQADQSPEPIAKPLFNIQSKKNLWQSANLGQMNLVTGRIPQGVVIQQLQLEGPDQKLTLTGDWKDNGITESTQLKGKLDLKKADRLFDKLNITKDLTETSGTIDFNLTWRNAPWQLSLPDLRGQMDVDLEDGRILSIEPGFGRLLGILAIEQWLRRIQLDFSDIFEEGLTFNTIRGHFELMNGKAVTNNLVIDAIPAMITISGETDLAKQTIDHVIKVVPKSSDAVPIAGTIVGELASLVGKSLTGKDQEGFFFGSQYRVKGSWDDAKISSLHENDGIFQKTWNNITDFSWLEQNSGNQKNNNNEAINE